MRASENIEEQDGENLPDFMLTKQHEQDVIIFSKRAERDDFITNVVRNLSGIEIYRDDEGNIHMREGNHQIMSIEAATQLYNWLRMNINIVTSMTNWSEEQANIHFENNANAFSCWLYHNYKNIKIKYEMLEGIDRGFKTTLHAQMNGSIGGAENKAITEGGQRQSIEYKMSDNRKKNGFFPFGNKKTEGASGG
jgi:hypothetical protein